MGSGLIKLIAITSLLGFILFSSPKQGDVIDESRYMAMQMGRKETQRHVSRIKEMQGDAKKCNTMQVHAK